ncbi:terminase gpP N-terminus-related DNA-binding protein [Tenacibaculum sp. M341]|uniref:terminase gpP N-terminus-related DNA-binding protein n=1 Tax=Tenacibaculum sp. M341 TaxID=2530339 RepID=UPI00268C5738
MTFKNKIDTKKAYKYYCLGLNSKEIAKLLDCSYRTIQNYMTKQNWKKKRANLK